MKVVNGCWLRVEGDPNGECRAQNSNSQHPSTLQGSNILTQRRPACGTEARRGFTTKTPRHQIRGKAWLQLVGSSRRNSYRRKQGEPRHRTSGQMAEGGTEMKLEMLKNLRFQLRGQTSHRWYKAGQRSCLSVTFVFFAGEKASFVSDKTRLYRLVTDKPTSRLVNAMIWFEFSRVRKTEKRSGWLKGEGHPNLSGWKMAFARLNPLKPA